MFVGILTAYSFSFGQSAPVKKQLNEIGIGD